LRAELEQLHQAHAPGPPDAPASREARQIALERTLQSMEIVPPPPPPWDQVRFGAAVTVRDRDRNEETYQIVGLDEADPAQDQISWLSPLARGLTNARLGERIKLKLPAGERELEIVAISYPRR
jgi:transcription elongation factor GreB